MCPRQFGPRIQPKYTKSCSTRVSSTFVHADCGLLEPGIPASSTGGYRKDPGFLDAKHRVDGKVYKSRGQGHRKLHLPQVSYSLSTPWSIVLIHRSSRESNRVSIPRQQTNGIISQSKGFLNLKTTCLLGAATSAVILPMVNGIGSGWAHTLPSLGCCMWVGSRRRR